MLVEQPDMAFLFSNPFPLSDHNALLHQTLLAHPVMGEESNEPTSPTSIYKSKFNLDLATLKQTNDAAQFAVYGVSLETVFICCIYIVYETFIAFYINYLP